MKNVYITVVFWQNIVEKLREIQHVYQVAAWALGLDGPPAILEILKIQLVCWDSVWTLGLSHPVFEWNLQGRPKPGGRSGLWHRSLPNSTTQRQRLSSLLVVQYDVWIPDPVAGDSDVVDSTEIIRVPYQRHVLPELQQQAQPENSGKPKIEIQFFSVENSSK